jgi:hypothetical protein
MAGTTDIRPAVMAGTNMLLESSPNEMMTTRARRRSEAAAMAERMAATSGR